MGKSVLAVQVAAAVASAGKSVRYQSLEMPSEDLMLRAIAAKSGINLTALRSGKMEQEDYDRLTPASAWAHKLKWLTDERAGVSVEQVCASSRRQKRRSGLDLLVVDHLHLMRVKGENRAAGLGQITATLKALAMELAIPVLLVAQINREAAKGGAARRPQLHELKDSGSVEQDADVVILIHREGYYDEKANPGEAELIVAKQRNGAVGTVSVGWDASSVRFTNAPPNWESPSQGEKTYWSDL
jgi:replicative DNA helicase